MAWQRDWDEATAPTIDWRRKGPVTRLLETEPESYECPMATFDGGDEDLRLRVYYYQQTLRATLLAKAAGKATRPSRWRRALAACERSVRWLWLAEPRAADAPATIRPVTDPVAATSPVPRLLASPA